MPKQARQHISFKATKIVSKPVKVIFYTRKGEEVSFRAKKFIPKSVRVEFLAKKKK
ncbi:MAG: hypothetical protein NT136_02290 [Candidatus Moranbacteria bacterium]|nr:hypothetical protein [Candidatus Moranbacteria bacterium]